METGTINEGDTLSSPSTTAGAALAIERAAREGKSIGFRGTGSWQPVDADEIIDTAQLTRIVDISERDLTLTVEAGVTMEAIRTALGSAPVDIMWDPPGGDRTVGSIVATATSGPLTSGFGRIRDQLLGATFVTGAGRVVRAGGRVMKNVAGFDLTRLACGSHGALGFITELHLRLRPKPSADRTLRKQSTLGEALQLLDNIRDSRCKPVAYCFSLADSDHGTFDVKFSATAEAVGESVSRLEATAGTDWREVENAVWTETAAAPLAFPITVHAGVTDTTREQLAELALTTFGTGMLQISGAGLRWSGSSPNAGAALAEFRTAAAKVGVPVTVERAPENALADLGITGVRNPAVAEITSRLRAGFDPYNVLAGGRYLVARD